MLSLLLTVVGMPQTVSDEAAFARAAVPIPEVGREDSPLSEWSLYTAEAELQGVRQKLDRALKGRAKWTRTPLGWEYDDVDLRKSPNLRVSVAILSGRAMRRQEAAPQKNRWTTVRITIERYRSISRNFPYRDWVLATRTEDGVAVNVPIGQEMVLPRTDKGRFDRNGSTVQVTARTPGLGSQTPNRWRTPL